MVERPQKITLGKMRASRVHGLLIYVPVSFRILICFIGLIGWEQAPAALARPVPIIPAVKFEKSSLAKCISVIRSAPDENSLHFILNIRDVLTRNRPVMHGQANL